MTKPLNLAELVDRRVLQAERDIARAGSRTAEAERRVAEAETAVEAAATTVQAMQAALDEMHGSTSWRISHPVRVASRLLQAFRPAAPPPPLPTAPARPPEQVPLLPPREQAILLRLRAHRPG